MMDSTLYAGSFESNRALHSMLPARKDPVAPMDDADASPLFRIRRAHTTGRRASASILIRRRYAWRGYQTAPLPEQQESSGITLLASDDSDTIGTMSIGFDGEQGLLVEQLFPDEVRGLREAGHRICEFTKLAMDGVRRSKRVLASLFHVAYIYAYRVKGYDCLLIEVNPRHVTYYEKILGFQVMGPARMNSRVNAPAVLLRLDFSHTEQQIGLFGGQPQMSASERSLYPYTFSVEEEAAIVGRLKGELATGQIPVGQGNFGRGASKPMHRHL